MTRPAGDAAGARKLRVLCLHGYRGSAATLRAQARALEADAAPIAEFVYLDAPSLAAGDFGWWHAERDGGAAHYRGWAISRDAVVAAFGRLGPFDGVFGFSQGAALASLLVGLRAPAGPPTHGRPLAFDFALLAGGFASADPAHAALYEASDAYALPTAHVIGRADAVVPAAASRALAARFHHPLVLEHAGGHALTGDAATRAGVLRFLAAMRRPAPAC